MAEANAEQLHERILAHLDQQAKMVTEVAPTFVNGIKSTQGGKPFQMVDCPNCRNVFGMSGHESGKVFCNHCGTLCVVTPVDPPKGR